jgi:glucose/arabinose dehydrogenase
MIRTGGKHAYIPVLVLLFLWGLISAGCVTGSNGLVVPTEERTVRVIEVADGLEHPWGMEFLPDGGILVTERSGDLVLVREEKRSPVEGPPEVAAVGQGGLLDVLLDAQFDRTGLVYLTYSTESPDGSGRFTTALGRGRLSGTALLDWEELFVMSNPSRSGRHFGSRIAFGTDGFLYMTVGERGERNRAQNLNDHGGSVLRLTGEGDPAPGNPFAGTAGALPELFSIGHRNPQGMTVNPWTGEIWAHEHGPLGGDEVNIVRAGNNYGWPVITHGREYSGSPVGGGLTEKEGLEQPLIHWEPSIAPSGMTFYSGSRYPEWRGDLFLGALAGTHLRRLVVDGETIVHEEVLLDGVVGRVRDVAQGPDGYLWILTDEDDGSLYRLE